MSRLDLIEAMVLRNTTANVTICLNLEGDNCLCHLHPYLEATLGCSVCPLDALEKWEEFKPCLD